MNGFASTPILQPASQSALYRWLCGDHSDRARYTDMHRRFRDAHQFGIAIGGTSLVCVLWYGWHLLPLIAAGSVTLELARRLSPRARRPEIVGAIAFALLEINLALSVLLTGGADSPLLPLMVVPVFTQAVCFPPRVTLAGVGLSAALAVFAVEVAPAVPGVRPPPHLLSLLAYLALLACLALGAYYLADADLISRGEAVIDPLTGLFNRKALEARFDDIRAQALALDFSVAVAMCDLDHFKAVNDEHGHDRGDRVLQELSYRLRRSLRTYDLVYRLGGEEFLVLLPGHDSATAAEAAERLREGVSALPIAGLAVTMSVGVSSARRGAIDLPALMKAADTSLYEAKRAGRNRVETAAAAR